MDNNELMHHGIVGMKWGVRRYQNRDGTLTARGKKRYEKEMAKLKEKEQVLKNREKTQAKFDKLASKKAKLDEKERELDEREGKTQKKAAPTAKSGPKSISEMTDKELQAVVNRLNLEKQYKDLNPPTVSKGKKFMDTARDEVLIPALKKGAKEGLEGVFKRVFGDAGDAVYGKIKGATKKTDETIRKTVEKEKKKAEEERNDNTLTKLPKDKSPNRNTTTKDDAVEWLSGTVSDGDRSRTSSETGLAAVDEYRKKKKK